MAVAYDLKIQPAAEAVITAHSTLEPEDEGFWYFIFYTDPLFVAHVRKHLPQLDIDRVAYKGFHQCGVGFPSEAVAKERAEASVVHLLRKLEAVTQPWQGGTK